MDEGKRLRERHELTSSFGVGAKSRGGRQTPTPRSDLQLSRLRLLTCVSVQVLQQAATRRKSGAARVAGIQLLTGVRLHVHGQDAFLTETFPAALA